METNHHDHEIYDLSGNNLHMKKKLRVATIITMLLGFLSVIALLFTFLALCDIGNHEPDLTLEWKIVGIGLLIWMLFIVSTIVTLTYLFRIEG